MVWTHIVHFCNALFDENSDPRISNWTTANNPLPTLFICLLYFYVAKYLGPRIMEHRKPLDVRWFMIFYNFSMVIFNIIIFNGLGKYGWFGSYSYKCQPVDYSSSPEAIGMLNFAWWYYLSKIIDFTDTVIFIMRKKYNQVTTLHVVHHGLMPMSTWFGLKFTPGGHSTFFAFINSFVHILMYSYYGLAAIGPRMNKFLWWKKYMTTIQMIQFVIIFIHAFQLLFRDCNYPQSFVWWIGLHAVLFWILFIDFYKNTYQKSKAPKVLKRKASESNTMTHLSKDSYSAMNGYNFTKEMENAYTSQDGLFNNNCDIYSSKNNASDLTNKGDLVEPNEEKKVN